MKREFMAISALTRGVTRERDGMNSRVYLVQVEITYKFKIGVTNNLKRRLQQLQTGSPERLILRGHRRGDRHEEKRIHRALRKYQVRPGSEYYEFPEREAEFLLQIGYFSDDYDADVCQLSLFDES